MTPKFIRFEGQLYRKVGEATGAAVPSKPERELGTCQACGKRPATELYSISEDETYELCAECIEEEEAAATGAEEEKMHELCIVCEEPCVPGEESYDLDELQRHVHDDCYNSYETADEYYADTMSKE